MIIFIRVTHIYIYRSLLYHMGLHCKKTWHGGWGGVERLANENNKPAQTRFKIWHDISTALKSPYDNESTLRENKTRAKISLYTDYIECFIFVAILNVIIHVHCNLYSSKAHVYFSKRCKGFCR